MILVWLLIITFFSGLLAWVVGSGSRLVSRLICLGGLTVDAVIVLYLWINWYGHSVPGESTSWIAQYKITWIAPLGIHFYLAMDGLSLLLAALTIVLGLSSVISSWNEVDNYIGRFCFALMSVLTGVLGVFFAMDLFLFYFFWELMLVPMFFLLLIWGHERKTHTAVKFFIYTQAGSLFMLLSIIALYWIHGRQTGTFTFSYRALIESVKTGNLLISLGFFIAFAVKLPVIGVHMWLPDAYTEAPTAGSVILAGLLAKTAAYGMLRFLLPMVPMESPLRSVALVAAVVGIFYGGLMAFAQQDLKKLIAYTSISHLGFVLLGLFAGTQTALQGAVVIMIAHGLSTGALFIITGSLRQRLKTTDMTKLGGLWPALPRMGSMTLLFVLASLGLPGLANFIGEFLVLAGTFEVHPWYAGVAAFGFVVSVIYSLWIMYRVFHGPENQSQQVNDLRCGEMLNLGTLGVAVVWIGLFPQTILNTGKAALEKIAQPPYSAMYQDSQENPSDVSLNSGKNQVSQQIP